MKDWNGYMKCLTALCCVLFLLGGCGTENPADSVQGSTPSVSQDMEAIATEVSSVIETSAPVSEELSSYDTKLLQFVTSEFISDVGQKEDKCLITIDISAFEHSAEKYEEWIQTTYSDEDTLVLVFTEKSEVFQTMDAAEDFMKQNGYEDYQNLASGCEWTSIMIQRVPEEVTTGCDVMTVDIAYPITAGGKGLELQVKNIDDVWEIIRVKMTYVK